MLVRPITNNCNNNSGDNNNGGTASTPTSRCVVVVVDGGGTPTTNSNKRTTATTSTASTRSLVRALLFLSLAAATYVHALLFVSMMGGTGGIGGIDTTIPLKTTTISKTEVSDDATTAAVVARPVAAADTKVERNEEVAVPRVVRVVSSSFEDDDGDFGSGGALTTTNASFAAAAGGISKQHQQLLLPVTAGKQEGRAVDPPLGTSSSSSWCCGEYVRYYADNYWNDIASDGSGNDDNDDEDDDGTTGTGIGGGKRRCRLKAKWQAGYYPTCSLIHELDGGGMMTASAAPDNAPGNAVEYLGHGWLRTAWLVRQRRQRQQDDATTNSMNYNNGNDNNYVFSTLKLRMIRRPIDAAAAVGNGNNDNNNGTAATEPSEGKSIIPARLEAPMLYRQSRIESTALERLTSSRYVVDQYAYCGYALVTQPGYAIETSADDTDGDENKSASAADGTNDNIDGIENKKKKSGLLSLKTPFQRLEAGYHVAAMLADIHSYLPLPLPTANEDGGGTANAADDRERQEQYTNLRPTLAHGDFNLRNIFAAEPAKSGATDQPQQLQQLVVIDFNQAVLLRSRFVATGGVGGDSNNATAEPCRFKQTKGFNTYYAVSRPPERFADGKRPTSPAKATKPKRSRGYEMSDKVDVFSLGINLAAILTGQLHPFQSVLGDRPDLLPKPRVLPLPNRLFVDETTPTRALLYAALACFSFRPEDRPTAYRVAAGLKKAMEGTSQGNATSSDADIKALFIDDEKLFAGFELEEKAKDRKVAEGYLRSFKDVRRGPLMFSHIPKTGGTTIEVNAKVQNVSWGYCNYPKEGLLGCPSVPFPNKDPGYSLKGNWNSSVDWWHTPRTYFPLATVDPFLDAEVFAVIREPKSRMVSEFSWVCGPASPWKDACNSTLMFDKSYMNDWLQKKLRAKVGVARGHYVSQYSYIVGPQRVRVADHVLRMENLTTEFPRLMKAFSLEDIQLEKHYNSAAKSSKNLGSKDLEPETIQIIRDTYPDDIGSLGY